MTTSFVKQDPLAAAAAAAAETLAKMAGDYAAEPAQQLTRARERQGSLRNDADQHLAVQREIEALEAKVARGDTSAVLSDEQRLDLALGGKVDFLGAQTTVNQEVHPADFAAVIQDDVALGVPPKLLKAYHSTGKSDDPLGHVGASIWLSRFNSDPEWQRRFEAGDLQMQLRHRIAHYYLAGAHAGISPQQEADYRARFSAY
jgi:hypothetical protein